MLYQHTIHIQSYSVDQSVDGCGAPPLLCVQVPHQLVHFQEAVVVNLDDVRVPRARDWQIIPSFVTPLPPEILIDIELRLPHAATKNELSASPYPAPDDAATTSISIVFTVSFQ